MELPIVAVMVPALLSRLLMVVGLVVSAGMLLLILRVVGRESRIRPGFDLARVVLGVGAALLLGLVVSVQTPVWLAIAAVAVGLALGYLQGGQLQITWRNGFAFTRRTLLGIALWGVGLVTMQAAGLGSRTGVFRIGQTVAFFSVATTVGLMAGRNRPLRLARQTSTASVQVLLMILAVGLVALPAFAQEQTDEPLSVTYEGMASSHSSASLDFGVRGSVEYDNDRPFTITLNPDGTVDATWHAGPVTTVAVHCETDPPTGDLSTTPVDATSLQLTGTHGDGTFRITDPSGGLDIQGTYTALQIQAEWENSVSMDACGDFPDAGNLHLSGTSSFVLDRTSPPGPSTPPTPEEQPPIGEEPAPLPPVAGEPAPLSPIEQPPEEPTADAEPAEQLSGVQGRTAPPPEKDEPPSVATAAEKNERDPFGWLTKGDITTDEGLASAITAVLVAAGMGILTLAEAGQAISDIFDRAAWSADRTAAASKTLLDPFRKGTETQGGRLPEVVTPEEPPPPPPPPPIPPPPPPSPTLKPIDVDDRPPPPVPEPVGSQPKRPPAAKPPATTPPPVEPALPPRMNPQELADHIRSSRTARELFDQDDVEALADFIENKDPKADTVTFLPPWGKVIARDVDLVIGKVDIKLTNVKNTKDGVRFTLGGLPLASAEVGVRDGRIFIDVPSILRSRTKTLDAYKDLINKTFADSGRRIASIRTNEEGWLEVKTELLS